MQILARISEQLAISNIQLPVSGSCREAFYLPLLHLFLPEGNSAFAQHPGTWGLYDLSV
jgi:hypothetical protein